MADGLISKEELNTALKTEITKLINMPPIFVSDTEPVIAENTIWLDTSE